MDALEGLASDDGFAIDEAARATDELGADPKVDAALLAALERLIGRTGRGDGYAAGSVIIALGVRRVAGAAPVIVAYENGTELDEHDDDAQAQTHICEALATLGDASARPFLREAFARWELFEDDVAEALVRLGEEKSFFEKALASDRPAVVAAADDALAQLDPVHAAALIPRLLATDGIDARRKVVKHVRRLGSGDLARLLLVNLEAPDWRKDLWGRFDALDAIAAIDARRATATLESIARNDAESRWARLLASARLLTPESNLAAVAALIERFRVVAAIPDHDHALVLTPHILGALDAATKGTALRRTFIELADDIRRERIPIPRHFCGALAGKIVEAEVGSPLFSDYERWRASSS